MKKVLLVVGLFFLVLSFSVHSRELSCSLSLKEVRNNLQAYDQNNKLVELNDFLKITNLKNVNQIKKFFFKIKNFVFNIFRLIKIF